MPNINTFRISPTINQYQESNQNNNYNEKRVSRFYSKPVQNNIFTNNYIENINQQRIIQRSNTVDYNPRLTAIPKVSQNYYYNLFNNNNIQTGERRTISNNGRIFTLKDKNSQLKNTLNNMKIIPINKNNSIDNQISLDNKDNFPNLVKVTKIVTDKNKNNNEKKVNNIEQIKIVKNENNENIEKANNDNYKNNNETNKSEENQLIASKVTKINKEEKIKYQEIKDMNQFDKIDELIQYNEQMKILEKSSNYPLNKDKNNVRTQFAFSAHLPNTIMKLNNKYIINNPQYENTNTNIFNNNNINYIQQNLFSNTKKQENVQQNQTITPFLINNGEIMSNTKCHEYYRETTTAPVTSYGYSQNQNAAYRHYMEDEGRVYENLNGDPNKILFCLFDGHGGGQVSKFLQENFGKYMKKILGHKNIIAGFSTLFKVIDEDLKVLNCPNVGSTATIVYIEKLNESNKRILYCANVGDSRCVLVSKNGVYRLSYDDRVKDPQESERINKNGGIIVNNRVYGQLMLSRSFGDWKIKDVGVIVDPHVTRYELNNDDSFCVIASDGVWDVLKDEEFSVLEKMYMNTGEMSKKIIAESLRRNSFDNLSCFVISLK